MTSFEDVHDPLHKTKNDFLSQSTVFEGFVKLQYPRVN